MLTAFDGLNIIVAREGIVTDGNNIRLQFEGWQTQNITITGFVTTVAKPRS